MGRICSALLLAWPLLACSTLEPVYLSEDRLRQQLANEAIVVPGDRLRITMTDGKRHRFMVTEVTEREIVSRRLRITIGDIKAIEISRLDKVRTAETAINSVTGVAVAGALAVVVTILVFFGDIGIY